MVNNHEHRKIEREEPSVTGRSKSGEREVFNRRRFLQGTMGIAFATVLSTEMSRRMGFWRMADMGIGTLAELEEQLLLERERFAEEYLHSAEMPGGIQVASQLFVQTELVRYLRENPNKQEIDVMTFVTKTYRPFMDGVQMHFEQRQQDDNPTAQENVDTQTFGTPSIALIANCKQALYDQIGENPHYWAKKNNIVDVMTSSDLQCRSGSRMLLLTLLENVDERLQTGERLVVVYSNHHMQVALLTADQNIIAFEMTKSGKGIQNLGSIAEIKTPVIIADAKHELAQAGINTKAHPEETILLNNIPDTYTEFDRVFDKSGEFGGGSIRLPEFRHGIGGETSATTDQYGFGDGTVDVPDERVPITSMDYVPSGFSTGNASSEVGNSIYDTIDDVSRKTYGELLEQMTAGEVQAVREFEQHSAILSKHVNSIDQSYTRILRDPQADVEREVSNLLVESENLLTYMNENNLDTKYEAYRVAIVQFHERTHASVSFPRNPRAYVKDVVNHLQSLAN